MRLTGFAALTVIAAAAGVAQAAPRDAPAWYQRAHEWVQQLLGAPASDREVIAPSANIDPMMAIAPPQPQGTMRIITPRGNAGR